MDKQKWLSKISILLLPLLYPLTANASFIESTIGTAVVNDATAANYNPAALVLLKNTQIIPLATIANFHTRFSGSSTRVSTGLTQTGSASTNTNYYSPSLYFGMPATEGVVIGLAVLSNQATRNLDDNSLLRYVQASNTIEDFDLIPAIGIKVNDYLSLGAGVNFSYANFNLRPITGFPGSNIADSESNNQSDGTGMGADVGVLLRPSLATLIGFNYRSLTTYRLSGQSVYEGSPRLVANNYHFKLSTPARSTLSVNHFVNQKLGFIGTVQRTQWSVLRNVHVYNTATLVGTAPIIVSASVPYYLRNTWLVTLGSHYRVTPEWVVRVAGSYSQSPGNPYYQIANGDSIIVGASMGYDINKTITVDASYAHAFIKNQTINITGSRYLINGVNEASRNAVSLKLTFNL